MTAAAIVLDRMPAGRLRDVDLDTERRGWTPLMQHVRDGDEAAVARAIAGGADVDAALVDRLRREEYVRP
jgi:hypothetical protein